MLARGENTHDVDILWIECDYCGLWVRVSCTNNSNIEEDNIFTCKNVDDINKCIFFIWLKNIYHDQMFDNLK